MHYNISKFIVKQPLNENELLLYNTLSTSIITLENEMYKKLFVDNRFEDYPNECDELCEMGFLFTGAPDQQLKELESVRKAIVETEHGITAITIAPTMECNARCYYCFEKGALQGTMTEETADKTAQFIIERCTEKKLYIAWFGGEPLMASDIITRITKKLFDNNIEVESTVTSNGILIDEKMIEKFRYWNVKRVQITLDGLGDEYNKIKRYVIECNNPFERIMENISLLIENKFTVHLRVNYYSQKYETVKSTMDYLHNKFGNYDNLYLYGVPLDLPEKKGYSEFDELEGEVFLKVLNDSLKRGYENDELNFSALKVSKNYNKALGELMLAPFPASCYMVNKDRFVIDDKGYIYKCQKHLGKNQFSCGDVFNGIKKNDVYRFYVTDHLHSEICKDCNMLPICQGGCKANRLLYGDKYACPPSKSIINKLVMKYYEYLLNENRYC